MTNGKPDGDTGDQDSDQDLLTDDEEVFKYGTDPFDADTSETIRIMGEIDGVIEEHGGWPDAFGADQ